MSIKIYNGFRVKDRTFESLSEEFGEAVRPFLLKRAHQMIFNDALYFNDLATSQEPSLHRVFEKMTSITSPYDLSWNSLWTAACRKNTADTMINSYMTAKLVYISAFDGFDYCLVYGLDVEDTFASLEGVEEFGYWSNSDKPERLSDEEWSERLATWKSVLDFNKPVASQGLVYEVAITPYESLFDVYATPAVLFDIRSDEARLGRLSLDLAVQNVEDPANLSDIISAMDDTLALKKYAKELAPGLLSITHEVVVEGITKRA